MAHVPRVGPYDTDRLVTTIDGLHVRAKPTSYRVLNLDRTWPGDGAPLMDACTDPRRLAALV